MADVIQVPFSKSQTATTEFIDKQCDDGNLKTGVFIKTGDQVSFSGDATAYDEYLIDPNAAGFQDFRTKILSAYTDEQKRTMTSRTGRYFADTILPKLQTMGGGSTSPAGSASSASPPSRADEEVPGGAVPATASAEEPSPPETAQAGTRAAGSSMNVSQLPEFIYHNPNAYDVVPLIINDKTGTLETGRGFFNNAVPKGFHAPKTDQETAKVAEYLKKTTTYKGRPIDAGDFYTWEANARNEDGNILANEFLSVPVIAIPKMEVSCSVPQNNALRNDVAGYFLLDVAFKNSQVNPLMDLLALYQSDSAPFEGCIQIAEVKKEELYTTYKMKVDPTTVALAMDAATKAAQLIEEGKTADDAEASVKAAYDLIKEMPDKQAVIAGLKDYQEAQQQFANKGPEQPTVGTSKSDKLFFAILFVGGPTLAALLLPFIISKWRRMARYSAEQEVAVENERQKAYEKMGLGDFIDAYATNLVELAEKGLLDPVFGRKEEVKNIFDIWLQRGKTTLALTGEAGVGKSALFRALAIEIAKAKRGLASLCPPALKNLELFELDMTRLVAGTKYRGELEDRLRVLKRLAKANPRLRKWLIDEGADNLNAGKSEGGSGVLASLKGDIGKGEFGGALALTDEDYAATVAKDRQLARRFPEVRIEESPPDTITIIVQKIVEFQDEDLRAHDEAFNNDINRIEISSDALNLIVARANDYFDFANPDAAQDLAKRIVVAAYRRVKDGDRSLVQEIPGPSSSDPGLSAVITEWRIVITKKFVEDYIKTLKHPKIQDLDREIRIGIRTLANSFRITKEQIGYDSSALDQKSDEPIDITIRRIGRILSSINELLRILSNPNSTEEAVKKGLQNVRDTFARQGTEKETRGVDTILTDDEKKKKTDDVVREIERWILKMQTETLRDPKDFGTDTPGALSTLDKRSGEEWTDYLDRLERVRQTLGINEEVLTNRSLEPEVKSAKDTALLEIRKIIGWGDTQEPPPPPVPPVADPPVSATSASGTPASAGSSSAPEETTTPRVFIGPPRVEPISTYVPSDSEMSLYALRRALEASGDLFPTEADINEIIDRFVTRSMEVGNNGAPPPDWEEIYRSSVAVKGADMEVARERLEAIRIIAKEEEERREREKERREREAK